MGGCWRTWGRRIECWVCVLFSFFFWLVGWWVEGACGWIPELVFGWLGVVVLADHLTLGDTTSSYTDYLFLLFAFFSS